MSDWKSDKLGRYCYIKARIGWRGLASSEYTEDGPYLIAGKHVSGGRVIWGSCDHITHQRYEESQEIALSIGDVILTKDGTIGRVARIDDLPGLATINGTMMLLRPNSEIDYRFLYHTLNGAGFKKHVDDKVSGSSIPHIFQRDMINLPVRFPDRNHQRKIAEVLDTLDTAIQQTEAILEKLKAVKQGLLHDLLTRGIDANGKLRPPQAEAPHLYKESPLGWIPKKWDFKDLSEISESIIDGPFGSNLKTEHYVQHGGVRVVRLQNIQLGYYDDTEYAFISTQHAERLARNSVVPGDLLIAALGDDGYPIGRSCRYPANLGPAINKADCFRFRSNSLAQNAFIEMFMNGRRARIQVRKFEQGVTMKRINLGNLRRITVSLPDLEEQESIISAAESIINQNRQVQFELQKLRQQKIALMDDLLTGRVRVTPLLEKAA